MRLGTRVGTTDPGWSAQVMRGGGFQEGWFDGLSQPPRVIETVSSCSAISARVGVSDRRERGAPISELRTSRMWPKILASSSLPRSPECGPFLRSRTLANSATCQKPRLHTTSNRSICYPVAVSLARMNRLWALSSPRRGVRRRASGALRHSGGLMAR